MTPSFKLADYTNSNDANDLVEALNAYALDPMGGGEGLSEFAKQNLPQELAKLPHAFTILMYVDGQIAGLVNCLEGFSSFACKKLINIHDFAISPAFRGKGLSQPLMNEVEKEAIKRDCCKLTLEVLDGNKIAYKSYVKFGFESYELLPENGRAVFMTKPL